MKSVKAGNLAVATAVLIVAAPAMADMISVQANLWNGVPDSYYNAGTLTVSEGPLDGVVSTCATIGATYPPPGTSYPPYTNACFHLSTTFDSMAIVNGADWAKFVGGSVSLTFDLDGYSYEISGPIVVLFARVTAACPYYSRVMAEGLFDAVKANMPEAWIDFREFSELDSIVIDVSEDMSSFNWETDAWTAPAEATVQLVPSTSWPEPATLSLLAIGSLAVMRRRR